MPIKILCAKTFLAFDLEQQSMAKKTFRQLLSYFFRRILY